MTLDQIIEKVTKNYRLSASVANELNFNHSKHPLCIGKSFALRKLSVRFAFFNMQSINQHIVNQLEKCEE